jgi:hypothetical protein
VIYSPDNNFLLLKNYKVGSSSLELSLYNLVPENATCTPLQPVSESSYGHVPRNYIYGDTQLENHASYKEVCEVFGKETIDNTISVVFVRHPYEIIVSWFFHKMREYWGVKTDNNVEPFEYGGGYDWDALTTKQKDYLNYRFFYSKDPEFFFMNSTKWLYTLEDEIMVDHVLRYENGIEKEINKILPMVGLPEITIPYRAKSMYKPQHITYKDVFGKQELETIQEEWWWEFETFGYEP